MGSEGAERMPRSDAFLGLMLLISTLGGAASVVEVSACSGTDPLSRR